MNDAFWSGFEKEAEEKEKEKTKTHYSRGALIGGGIGAGTGFAAGTGINHMLKKFPDIEKGVIESAVRRGESKKEVIKKLPKLKKLIRPIATASLGAKGAIAGLGAAGLHHAYKKMTEK